MASRNRNGGHSLATDQPYIGFDGEYAARLYLCFSTNVESSGPPVSGNAFMKRGANNASDN